MTLILNTKIKFDSLTCEILDESELNSSLEFAFYLVQNNTPIKKTTYSKSNTHTFEKLAPGAYQVKAFIKNGESKFTIKTELIELSYNFFWKPVDRKLDFAPYDPPYADFLVTNFHHNLAELGAKEIGLNTTTIDHNYNGTITIIHSNNINQLNGKLTLLSGTCLNDEKILSGQRDSTKIDLTSITKSIGDFTILVADHKNQSIQIFSDYFGIGKLYIWRDGNRFSISNRFHLLALIAKKQQVNLTANKQQIAAILSAHNQPFVQAFNQRTPINEIELLPIGTSIAFEKGQLQVKQSEISTDLDEFFGISNYNYIELLKEATDEIKTNIREALVIHDYENVRIDVTSGLDARAIISAASHFKNYSSKIHIHTADVASSPLDLKCSLALTSSTNFQYDTIARTREYLSIYKNYEKLISHDLCGYYSRRPSNLNTRLPSTLRITGFYGEICARPYYSRILFDKNIANYDSSSIAAHIVANIPSTHRTSRTFDPLLEELTNQLKRTPGRTSLEQWDLHYLLFRNGFHCSDKWTNSTLAPAWGPLQSKTLFKLKILTYLKHQNIKLQLDAIAMLNADLALLPYGRQKDNIERENIKSTLIYPSLDYKQTLPPTDLGRFNDSKRILNTKVTTVNPQHKREFEQELIDFDQRYSEITQAKLNAIGNRGCCDDGQLIESLMARTKEMGSFLKINPVELAISNKVRHIDAILSVIENKDD